MLKKSVSFMFLACLVLLASTVLAQTEYTYPAGDPAISITFPAGWKVALDQNDKKGISAISKDEEIEFYIWPLDGEGAGDDPKAAIEKAAKEAGKDIAEWVTDATFKAPEAVEMNGIQFVGVEGSGKAKADGKAVNVSVTFLSPDGKAVFAVLYYGSPAAEKSFAQDLMAIAKSIKGPK